MAAIKGLLDSLDKSFEERLDSMGTATPVDLASLYPDADAVARGVESAARRLQRESVLKIPEFS